MRYKMILETLTMKKIRNILLAVVVLPCLVSAGMGVADHHAQADGKVYICTGPQSKRYHCTPKCKGLHSCSKKVIAVPLSKAKLMGRTPCGWCYD